MRVISATSAAPFAASTRQAARGRFSLGEATEARAAAQTSGPRALGGIGALLALQAVDDAPERRRRVVGRGRSALDALDALKVSLLAGQIDADALGRLKISARELEEASGDHQLDAVIAEISLRAQVELAKLGSI